MGERNQAIKSALTVVYTRVAQFVMHHLYQSEFWKLMTSQLSTPSEICFDLYKKIISKRDMTSQSFESRYMCCVAKP